MLLVTNSVHLIQRIPYKEALEELEDFKIGGQIIHTVKYAEHLHNSENAWSITGTYNLTKTTCRGVFSVVKVKVELKAVPLHAKKAQRGSRSIALSIFDLCSRGLVSAIPWLL
jgi:hypothetical protein